MKLSRVIAHFFIRMWTFWYMNSWKQFKFDRLIRETQSYDENGRKLASKIENN